MLYGKYMYSTMFYLAEKRRMFTPILLLVVCVYVYASVIFTDIVSFYIKFLLSYIQHVIGIVFIWVVCVCVWVTIPHSAIVAQVLFCHW